MTRLELTTARDKARRAVSTATSTKARDKAMDELEKATTALSEFDAGRASSSPSASAAPVRSTAPRAGDEDDEEEEEEEEEEEDEEEESEDDEPKKPMEDDEEGDDGDDDDDDDGDDDEEEEDDEEEKAAAKARASSLESLKSLTAALSGDKPRPKAAAKHAAALSSSVKEMAKSQGKLLTAFHQLKSAVAKATGKKSLTAMLGAIDALAQSAKQTTKLAGDVKKLKSDARKSRIDARIERAVRDGRVSPAQVASLREQGMSRPKFLAGFLATLPKGVHTKEAGGFVESQTPPSPDTVKEWIWETMTAEQRKSVEMAAAGSGKDVESFLAEMNKRTKSIAKGAPRRGV